MWHYFDLSNWQSFKIIYHPTVVPGMIQWADVYVDTTFLESVGQQISKPLDFDTKE